MSSFGILRFLIMEFVSNSDFAFWIFFSVTRLISAEHFLRSGHHVVRLETKLSLQFF